MREILFRGKAINRVEEREYRTNYKNGDWVYGLVTNHHVHPILPAEMRNEDGISDIEVDYETIGQYTGLKDKNGTRIFEGDVCKAYICKAADTVEKEVVGVICFEDGTFEFKCEHENIYLYPLIDVLEVIGNVFDSPELLGGKQ